MTLPSNPDVSVIVPARNEEACLADCLRTLVAQHSVICEIIVVDDHSSDRTRAIAESFPVRVITAAPLARGWSGKCNAAWTGAKAAKGKWLLFTDADTRHSPNSIATGLAEALDCGAVLLSYSPKQEVHSLAERALMPVIFAELARTFRPTEVSDPASPAAAANGQYILVRRDVYHAVGGHAAVASSILEDVELARRVKQAGGRLQFRLADTVTTRMYRTFPQMWEGWIKNLALLFARPGVLAFQRLLEFLAIFAAATLALRWFAAGKTVAAAAATVVFGVLITFFQRRIRRAHFDWWSNYLAVFGLPLFAILLLNSDISHRQGKIRWKGREYGSHADDLDEADNRSTGTYN